MPIAYCLNHQEPHCAEDGEYGHPDMNDQEPHCAGDGEYGHPAHCLNHEDPA